MPCDSDYLEPTARERELRRAARLLIYVCNERRIEIPSWAEREANNIYASDERSITVLCSYLKGMSEQSRDAIVYNARSKTARDLADWWEEHQAADAAREMRESVEKQREAARQAALKKLTDEEKEILGLDNEKG